MYAVSLRPNCGYIIQEPVDNIYINTVPIEGKHTFHSITRAIFQNSVIHKTFKLSIRQRFERKQNKSLVYYEKVCSLMQCFPYTKP